MKLFLSILTLLAITGCSNSPYDLDVENSPCACNYYGEQLNVTPSKADLKKIADLQFSRA